MVKKFQPFNCPKWFKIKNRYSFDWKFTTWNHYDNIIDKIFCRLHYLGSHSYVMAKWSKVEQNFLQQHTRRDF